MMVKIIVVLERITAQAIVVVKVIVASVVLGYFVWMWQVVDVHFNIIMIMINFTATALLYLQNIVRFTGD